MRTFTGALPVAKEYKPLLVGYIYKLSTVPTLSNTISYSSYYKKTTKSYPEKEISQRQGVQRRVLHHRQ
jgi:hypothetical protein